MPPPADRPPARGLAVPAGRLSRLVRFGGLATGIAGAAVVHGVRAVAQGRRPPLRELLLTPANVGRLTEQLARMRGAAMKLGQLLSLDAGDLLPPELAAILARLRADAHPMPAAQLGAVLAGAWGRGWAARFEHFELRPLAAASIGQVHRARTRDGRDLAVKVQYPGVRRSIDSDIDNVAGLLRLAGILPPGLDLAPLLAEAKRQLHQEADYRREGEQLARFGTLVADSADYTVPGWHADLTTPDVLAMDFVEGEALEAFDAAPQARRDRIVDLAVALMFRELFGFRLMQTDPNFANFRYDAAAGRLVLLDFGATRAFPRAMVEDYRRLMRAGVQGDREGLRAMALALGFFAEGLPARQQARVLEMMDMGMAPLRQAGPFDFAASDLAARVRDASLALGLEGGYHHVPPIGTLLLQRKFAGVWMLGARLRARVDLGARIAPWIA